MFRVGQKVVCVDDAGLHPLDPLSSGSVYTVAKCFTDCRNQARVHLTEFIHLDYFTWRFRPAVDRPTDISIFTEILRKSDIKEPV